MLLRGQREILSAEQYLESNAMGGGKEDIRKGVRVSSCSANTFANASASFKGAKLVRNIRNRKGDQDHLCMVTKADRSDEDWQQGQLAPPPGPVF
jgi:hypothetical protein